MRNHNVGFRYLKISSADNEITNKNQRTTIAIRQELTGYSQYSFFCTDFDHCESSLSSDKGGAIYCETGALMIENCSFINCKSEERSGAVFFCCSFTCRDINNFFANNSGSKHTGTFDDASSTDSVHSLSKYVNSTTPGHFGIMNVEATSYTSISSCVFINGSAGLYCGLLSLTRMNGSVSVSDCIFSSGRATEYGGAVGTYQPYEPNTSPVLSFSFFCNNFCSKSGRGADFDANGTTGNYFSKDKIIHCFSVSSGLHIHINGKRDSDAANWLI